MSFLPARITLATLLFATLSTTALAGPIWDAIQARRAERAQSRQTEAVPTSTLGSSTLTLPTGAKLLRDIAYGSDGRQRMDVYLPAQAMNAPVIFMVHGGAWRTGDKAMVRVTQNKIQRWVTQGFIFISINYRLLPNADPALQADDVAQALASAQAKALGWGGDPRKFILMGHSAGAHLVDLLGAAPDRAIKLGAQRWLGTVSLDSAAMDIVQIMQAKHYKFYDTAFGQDPAYWQRTSPLHQLATNATPLLLVCSSIRPDAPCKQARQFADKAHALGIRAEVLPQALKHSEINEFLGKSGAYTDAVERFMASLDPQVKQQLANQGTARP
ncbi:MAG: alpha/beta hydrolase [Formivibrio sp.]|nr:alpha/beta hydrolase [Formivibrio sp.]